MSQRTVDFPTDYSSILDRIAQVDPIAYGRSRHFVTGAVTYLSPYISRGVISVKHVRDSALSRGYQPSAIEKFLQELAWREYFQRVWQAKGDGMFQDMKRPQPEVRHFQMPDAIVNASTGIVAIDKAIKELYTTGYVHNHVRMYIASIACNIGRAHWSAPARWMYAHLLDGDLASNTCSWQWVAGAFSGKKYFCDQQNVNRYTNSFQENTFLDTRLEDLAGISVPTQLTATSDWSFQTPMPSFPLLQINVERPTLIYNSYNLDPLWRKGEDVNRVLLLEPSHFQKFPVHENVMAFILSLSRNIDGIQIMTGEVSDLIALYGGDVKSDSAFISKEHPAFTHYPGRKDSRDWMFPSVTGYFPSFFAYWKRAGSYS